MTQLVRGGVPDSVYNEAARVFDEGELANLLGTIISSNAWNLLGVSTQLEPPVDISQAGPHARPRCRR